MLSEEKINLNYISFIKRLQTYNCYSEEMINDMGELIKNAPFTTNEQTGGAYQGGLIDIVLNMLCKIGYQINENCFGTNGKDVYLHNYLYVNKDMLMKVLLLQHISKAEMFVQTREQWKIKKGTYYDFNENLHSKLKLGERTLYLCSKYGIRLAEEEVEAILSIDKDEDKGVMFLNPLSSLVRLANQCILVELRQKYNKEKKIETVEQ